MSLPLHNFLLLLQSETLSGGTLPVVTPSFFRKPPIRIRTLSIRHAIPYSNHSHKPQPSPPSLLRNAAIPSLIFFASILYSRLLLGFLLPDLPDRWRRLIVYSEQAELMSVGYPSHLFNAVVASEDRRFFRHGGIDLFGLARAVVYFPKGGGGSTITQQLVKNIFLKNERKISRKVIEMVLAVMLERRMSKWRILRSYLTMIYWGHGMYGVESASLFYFRKHPSLLTLGESAILAGILPAPDLRSPSKDQSRGKFHQIRVLKRMITAGFLDINSALLVVTQPLYLNVNGQEYTSGTPYSQSFKEVLTEANKGLLENSAKNGIWDWELASRLWEAREDLKKWAIERRY